MATINIFTSRKRAFAFAHKKISLGYKVFMKRLRNKTWEVRAA
jgi:hypothetical protein